MRNPVVSYTSFRHQLQQQGQMLWFWTCAMTTNGMLATSRAQTDPKRSATALMLAMYSVCCLGLDCGAFFCNYNSDKQSLCGVLQCCTAQSSLWMVCTSAGSHMHASIVTANQTLATANLPPTCTAHSDGSFSIMYNMTMLTHSLLFCSASEFKLSCTGEVQ